MNYLSKLAFAVVGLVAMQARADFRIVFPDDECVIDVKRDFGARGDGTTDDTAALQAALDAGSGGEVKQHKIVYLPNGIYRIRDTLVVNREKGGSGLGPWLYGESRDGVIIRLDDGVEGVNSVLRTHPKDEGKTSANWFMRTVRNLTIDAGDNPETDGVRWFASNTGSAQGCPHHRQRSSRGELFIYRAEWSEHSFRTSPSRDSAPECIAIGSMAKRFRASRSGIVARWE